MTKSPEIAYRAPASAAMYQAGETPSHSPSVKVRIGIWSRNRSVVKGTTQPTAELRCSLLCTGGRRTVSVNLSNSHTRYFVYFDFWMCILCAEICGESNARSIHHHKTWFRRISRIRDCPSQTIVPENERQGPIQATTEARPRQTPTPSAPLSTRP